MNNKEKIENMNFLIIGDIMVDVYLIGDVNRISPEAPVPIVEIKSKRYTLGGCGNVVKNLRNIGCKCDCISQISNDQTGNKILELLDELNVSNKYIINNHSLKSSTKKTRILNKDQEIQLLRIDEEDIKDVDDCYLKFINNIDFKIYDSVIISDYGKGMITSNLMKVIKNKHNKIFIDPKPINKHLYDDVYMITPNKKEWDKIKDIEYKNIKYVLNTLGKRGMIIYEKNKPPIHLTSEVKNVFNVSGAGDTVISTVVVCDCLGINILNSCQIANQSAQYVVQQPGTSYIPQSLFLSFFE